jgi:hypothetical protein
VHYRYLPLFGKDQAETLTNHMKALPSLNQYGLCVLYIQLVIAARDAGCPSDEM